MATARTPSALALELDCDPSVVSRWINGHNNPRPPSLGADVLPKFTPEHQRRLLRAYLEDAIPDGYHRLVSLEESDTTLREEPPVTLRWPDHISEELQRDLYDLSTLARDIPEIRAIVEEFGRLARKNRKLGS